MEKDLSKLAQNVLGSDRAEALREKSGSLEQLANSPDGRSVKAMLARNGSLEDAVARGDTAALRDALSRHSQNGEGQRLARQLGQLLEGKIKGCRITGTEGRAS
jgi:anaerobic glycerol-3-phosphate dehydrogenase